MMTETMESGTGCLKYEEYTGLTYYLVGCCGGGGGGGV